MFISGHKRRWALATPFFPLRSPAMAYADGELWCSTLDEAGNRCW